MNSNAKGKRGERELAKYLTDSGYPARRGQQYCGIEGDDIVCIDFPFHIECKRVQKLNLNLAMMQSIADAKEKPACVIHRRDREEWYITCRLDDFTKTLNWVK